MTLSRSSLRKLKVGERAYERGVCYERLQGDGRWSLDLMVAGVRHRETIGLESEGYTWSQAQERAAELRARKRVAQHGVPSKLAKSVTVAQAIPDYLDHLRSHGGKDVDRKAQRLRDHVARLLGSVRLAHLTEQDWEGYVGKRVGEGASPATVNRERAALLHLLNTHRRRKLLGGPTVALSRQSEPPSRLVFLSPTEAHTLLQAARGDVSPHAEPFCMIALFTGMRQAPILNLRAGDVDPVRRMLWVADDKAGRREQPMPAALAEYLRYFIAGMEPGDHLFYSPRSATGRLRQANAMFARVVKAAGLPPTVTPHALRHTMATNAAHAGLDAATIQVMGGWKTRQMAERYTHARSITAAMDAFEARMIPAEFPRTDAKPM